MSLLPYIKTREYVVTVYNQEDLESIYEDLETLGKTPANIQLTRAVVCVDRRPISRNTLYRLTDWEADELKRDPRVQSVTISPNELGIKAGTCATTQTSSSWNKSTSTSNDMKNWGLLRCYEGEQRTGWGGSGYEGNGSGTNNATGTITLTQTGKNVDVVICDENGLVWSHPEYARNVDGTGFTRAIQYNWFVHDPVVKGTSVGTYVYGTGSHSTHVAGTVAGNTQGWARDANIYNLYYDAGTSYNFSYVFDYIREFHRNKSINPDTGRKNPTIVNNSWGQSIFPSEWGLSDITAVTYRGTRYTAPGGTNTYTGVSGVYTANNLLANFTTSTLENIKQRIVNSGSLSPHTGGLVSVPPSWTQDSAQSAYLTILTEPEILYSVTVNGPAEISFRNNVASGGNTGTCSLTCTVQIKDASNVLVASFSDGPYTGLDVEADVVGTYTLPNAESYTINYITSLDTTFSENPLTAAAMTIAVTPATEGNAAASTANLTFEAIASVTGLSSETTPTVVADNTTNPNDDGYWIVDLPFNVNYLGTSYDKIYISTNFYFTFGGGSLIYSGISASQPNLPKIMVGASDNSMQRIYYGSSGTTPNREFRIVMEGNAATSGTLGTPGMRMELKFYENIPRQFDLTIEQNNRRTQSGGGFSTNQLNSWGFISGQRIPARVDACDADIEDLYAEGIIMVGAAGNGRWKHCLPGDPDWNNTFEMANRYPGSVIQPYYYMRGTSPTANDTTSHPDGVRELPAICVGSVDSTQIDQKVLYSDCGTGVDLYAPGTHIISSLPSGVSDARNSGFYLGKYSGTSMASPQVCGVIACALELYPHWNQVQAKEYITKIAKANQLTATSGGPADGQDLQGAPNLFLYYRKERAVDGNVFPKTNYNFRPSSGAVYPRPRVRRTL